MPSLPVCFWSSLYLYYIRALYIRTQVLWTFWFDTKHAVLLLVCVYLHVYFLSVFGFHLTTIIAPSCNFRITRRTAFWFNWGPQRPSTGGLCEDCGRFGDSLNLGVMSLSPSQPPWVSDQGASKHPSAMPAVWINWTSLDNCCRHSQRRVTVPTCVVTSPSSAAIPGLRRSMYRNIVFLVVMCILLSNDC